MNSKRIANVRVSCPEKEHMIATVPSEVGSDRCFQRLGRIANRTYFWALQVGVLCILRCIWFYLSPSLQNRSSRWTVVSCMVNFKACISDDCNLLYILLLQSKIAS